MKRFIIVITTICACAGLVAESASARKVTIRSTITVSNPTAGTYTGKVAAEKERCGKERTVLVWHDTNGNGVIDDEPADFLIGIVVTDASGNYTLTGNQAPIGDRVIAEVLKEKRGNKKCLAATAETNAFPGFAP